MLQYAQPQTKPGQHLAGAIHKIVKQLIPTKGNSRFKLTFRWSAGHVGIEGNEAADLVEAKKAADSESSDPADLPSYLRKPVKHSLTASSSANGLYLGQLPLGIATPHSRIR